MKSTSQLPLFAQLVMCPGCNREVSLLGQWHPWSKGYICKRCSEKYPMPDVYDSERLAVKQEHTPELDAGRTMNVAMENALFRLRKGCILTLDKAMSPEGLPCDPMKPQRTLYIWDCAKCRRDAAYENEVMRRGGIHRLNRLNTLPANRAGWGNYTIGLPFCKRCGEAHDRKCLDGLDYRDHCQHCDDLNTVEALWRHRGIFGDDDVEDIMDRIQNGNPGVFERGVLPDYWFELMIKESEK